ncbi:MAG: hypothetical protein OQK23_06635, partial [Rhodospirillales bacterium]|nr:hypothetical protein [Rhodospirillales bacterium]
MRRRRLFPFTAALLLAAALVTCAPLRAVESFFVLADLATMHDSVPLPPTHTTYDANGIPLEADIYQTTEGRGAGLVLVPGASRAGKDDPRLKALAGILARAGFTVMVPDIPNLRTLRVAPEDARTIAAAARHLTERTNGPVGVAALSYAVGPAVLAALDTAPAPSISFIVGIGGYHDLHETLAYMTTGHARSGPDAPWVKGNPNPYGKWAFVRANADRLSLPDERRLMARIADIKLHNPNAPIDALRGGLGPEGRAVMALLDNPDPDQVSMFIDSLPATIRTDIDALDISRRDLSAMTTR